MQKVDISEARKPKLERDRASIMLGYSGMQKVHMVADGLL